MTANNEDVSADELARYVELQRMALDLARRGETEPLQAMIAAGLPVNLADEKGQCLLMLPSYNGNLETTRMLLEHGAESDRRNDRGQTPLGGVAFKGYKDIAAVLLDFGADPMADNGGGMTPLSFARMFGRREVVNLLEARGAQSTIRDHLIGLPARLMMRRA
ncbi:MAG: ankyrin repeat domain-containing protein [Opitutales bacterium]